MRRPSPTRPTLLAVATLAVVASFGTPPVSADEPVTPAGDLRPAAVQPVLTGVTEADGKAPSSALARTPARLRTLTSDRPVPVMIKLDYDALASYRGGIAGYAATSPSVTGRRSSPASGEAATRYRGYVRQQERRITADVVQAVPDTVIGHSYRVVYGGVSAVVPGNEIKRLLRVPGVVAVQPDTLRQPLDVQSDFVGARAAYSALGSSTTAGAGLLFADLDSGVWPEHPSFAARADLPARTGAPLPCVFGDNPLTPAADPFVCNNKLVAGEPFTRTYDAQVGDDPYAGTARDSEGHGSHTSATAGGNPVEASVLGRDLGAINGIAPGVQIGEYKVCGPQGCFSSDSAAAVGQAILDGASVINFSISGGKDPLTDPVELAFLDAYNAGVFVAASAGNSGPGAATADHASPWVTTVGASTLNRQFASDLTVTAADGATYAASGASITQGAGPLPLVLASAAPYGRALCDAPAAPGLFTGKIVVCARGGNARIEKGYNVLQGGAAGMVLYNPALADTETDNHWLPAVHLPDGTGLLAFLTAHPGTATASFTAGQARAGQGDVMAAFSSRGPLGPFVKPDVTAPGVQILAAMTPAPLTPAGGPPGQYYQAIAGTSMAAPHVAGAALLVKAVHPNWTPGQIKSALMTQAVTRVVKEDLTTPADPLDMGAGRIDVGRAIAAPLTISETGDRLAALTADPVHAIDANLPSINAPTMPGRVTTTRTVVNVTGRTLTVVPRTSAGAGTSLTVSPRVARIAAGASRTFTVTIASAAPVGVQQFGSVSFVTQAGTARLPVAFVPRQGTVSLDQSCTPTSLRVSATATCTVTATNQGTTPQDVTATTSVNAPLTLTGATGASVSGGRATATATLAPPAAGVPSVGPGVPPAGYLPLDQFGIIAQPVGDEEFLNLTVPAFVYNGVTQTSIAVSSNGFVKVGTASSADQNCCNLPDGPSAAPPNDVLAPFWTDLDGIGAPGILAGTLTDGVNNWIVVEWRVNVFGTTSQRVFQTWIGTNGTQDISFTYDPGQLPAAPGAQPFLVGAENAVGLGDMEAVTPTQDLVVTSTAPTAGDSLSYSVTVRGRRPGPGVVRTEMTAPGVPGTTVATTSLPVTRR